MNSAESADRVWLGMSALVLNNDRRKEVSDALGISFFRAKALRRLAKAPMCQRDLAAMLSTDRPYTTLLVDDLERRGLVERTVDPDDRRSKIVTATPAGIAAAELADRILDTPPKALRDLDPADLEALDRIIAALLLGPGRS
jgi:DNA-binding MarR family transcriptional regulator